MPTCSNEQIRTALQVIAAGRAFPATFCPSEVARHLAADWRPLMPGVRREATRLIAEGSLECLQRGRVVEIDSAIGAIRLRRVRG